MPLLQNIALGKYVRAESPVHRLDPRTKFLCTVALMVATMAVDEALAIAAFAAAAGGALVLSRLPASLLVGNLRSLGWLFSFTFLFHALMTPGAVLWYLPFVEQTVTVEGLRLGGLFVARLVVVVTAASLMTLTTAPMELTDGLERLASPLRRFGFPAHELALMITIAIRFIPVVAEEAERLRRAQLARGADFSGNPVQRARKLVPLLVPLFLSTFARADRLALAMESRCYCGGEGRTSYRELRFRPGDLYAVLVLGSAIVLALWLPGGALA